MAERSLFSTPKGHTAVMAARNEPPESADYFPTPPWATRALFTHALPAIGVTEIKTVWEPACGEGHMAEVLSEFAGDVTASDAYQYDFSSAPLEFLNDDPLCRPDWIITNPPFKLACEFALHALDLAKEGVALLVRTQWVESIGRYEKLFRDRPPTLYAPFVERVPMVKGRWDPDASTATSYAWFIWYQGATALPRVFWIPPGCRNQLTLADDRQRFAAWSLAPAAAPLLDIA